MTESNKRLKTKRTIENAMVQLLMEHDGEELINYANFGFWKSKISQEDANIQFLRDNPEFLLIDTDRKRHYFSEKEFEELLKKAHEVSDADGK